MPAQTHPGRSLARARQQTDDLFRLVRPDSLYERPIAERHRMVFYLGHLEAFDWNLIGRYALDRRSFQPEFDKLFAFGIDPAPGELPSDQPSDWPGLAEVERYNQRVRDEIDGVLESALESIPEQLLHVALEHRLMHAETFANGFGSRSRETAGGLAVVPGHGSRVGARALDCVGSGSGRQRWGDGGPIA